MLGYIEPPAYGATAPGGLDEWTATTAKLRAIMIMIVVGSDPVKRDENCSGWFFWSVGQPVEAFDFYCTLEEECAEKIFVCSLEGHAVCDSFFIDGGFLEACVQRSIGCTRYL